MAPLRSLHTLLGRSPLLAVSPAPAPAPIPEAASPIQVANALRVRDTVSSTTTNTYDPGHGVVNPVDLNNKGFFALFALLGVVFVIAGIWFFFWAKNGGFVFRKGDWEDYKSTVLRRKGPDGKTLSNATKSTKLGGGSVVSGSEYTDTNTWPSYQDSEKGDGKSDAGGRTRKQKREKGEKKDRKRHHRNRHDDDVLAYRTEKPARVGGLNKEHDGTVHDYTTTAPSTDSTSQPAMSEVHGGEGGVHRQHRSSRHYHDHLYQQQQLHRSSPADRSSRPRRDFSFNDQPSEASFSVTASDLSQSSTAPLRPNKQATPTNSPSRTSPAAAPNNNNHKKQYQTNRERRSQGYYAARASQGSWADPIDFHGGRNTTTTGVGETASPAQVAGTKSYKHTIPGLTKGPAGTGAGFRRGGGRRRDSLSDSDGEMI